MECKIKLLDITGVVLDSNKFELPLNVKKSRHLLEINGHEYILYPNGDIKKIS